MEGLEMRRRKKPYTDIGIKRIPCSRCGVPSSRQWQVCANGNLYLGVCDNCDIELNALVLEFMKVPGRKTLMKKYIREGVC